MASTNKHNFDWLCRTCMQELVGVTLFDANTKPQQQWRSIADTVEECGSLRISELISNTILHLEVHLGDELPKKICRSCLQSFINAHRLQQTCLKSQQKYHTLIAKRNADLAMALTEVSFKDEKKVDEFLKQEPVSKARNKGIDFEYVNASTVSPITEQAAKVEISSNEFLNQERPVAIYYGKELEKLEVTQSNNDSVEQYIKSQDELSEFLKNEPCDDGEWKVGDSPGEFVTNEPCNDVDNKVLIVETEEAQAILDNPTLNCSLCNKSFTRLRYLNTHLKSHKKPGKAKRMHWRNKQVADNEPSVERSGDIVANEARNDDDKCLGNRNNETVHSGDTAKSKISVVETKEQQISMGSSGVQCHLCYKTFNHKRYLTTHLDWHRRINFLDPIHYDKLDKSLLKHVCDLCDQSFSSTFSLKRHNRLKHSGDKPNKPNNRNNGIPCGMCHKTFSKRFSLIRHINSQHSTEKVLKRSKFICDNCGEAFVCQSTLTFHELQFDCSSDMSKHKTNQEAVIPNVCDFCKKIFKYSCELRHHIKHVHTSERPFKCPECGKGFKTKGSLSQHILRHSEDKPYECPYCPQRFSCIADMSKHKKIHAEFKRFLCDICGNSFGTSPQLKYHKMRHSSERPHKCDFCGMRFNRVKNLGRHMRTHTGAKPYKCKYCDRAYAQSNDHIKHLRGHVGDKVYRCELCPLAFRLASELRLHFATHKNDDEETRERNIKALKEEETKLLSK